jgi:hypothetical protein
MLKQSPSAQISDSQSTANDRRSIQPNLEKKIRFIYLCSRANRSSLTMKTTYLPEDVKDLELFVSRRAEYKSAKMPYKTFSKSNIHKSNANQAFE